MTCIYDKEVFDELRKKAITEKSDFVIGETYYTNVYVSGSYKSECKHSFVFKGALDERSFATNYYDEDAQFKHVEYFRDSNVGGSYNPWLIFDNEDDLIECQNKMPVTFSSDYRDFY